MGIKARQFVVGGSKVEIDSPPSPRAGKTNNANTDVTADKKSDYTNDMYGDELNSLINKRIV